jgi:GntR family transcriptional regulator/MocR family aminotransferase
MSDVDLHLDLRGPRVRAGLTGALRDAVRSGRLAPGSRLPSSRSLAADLGIARNTVVAAYASLVDEGWLVARQGAGTQVAYRYVPPADDEPAPDTRPRHDLRVGRPDTSSFPRAEWARATRRVMDHAAPDAFGYPPPAGRAELRRAVADYLARARGVHTDPGRVVICAGASHGMTVLAATLRARRVDAIAVEAYGMPMHRDLFAKAGLRTPPLSLDANGARTDRLGGVGAVALTPAHQFPTGVALHPDRRAAAVDWARASGGVIVEDDYDGEFRYDRQPVGALQGLDPEHVVYVGTASKAVAPGLRLGWLVVPDRLHDDVARALGDASLTSSLEQLVLADLLDSGAYDKHVRTMRTRYRRRRDELADMLADTPLRLSGISAGLHALIDLPRDTEATILRTCAAARLAVYGMDAFRHPAARRDRDALVVGFGTPAPSAWPGALDALSQVLA